MNPATPLRPVPGFERSAYRLAGKRIVWAGTDARTDHPRRVDRPWQPPRRRYRLPHLATGAAGIRAAIAARSLPAPGLLAWLTCQALPFPWQAAQARLDTFAQALSARQPDAFRTSARAVLGLGPGLTPSGDDLIGGVMFTWAQCPAAAGPHQMPSLRRALHAAALELTNPISAALLDDLMAGRSYRLLHDFFDTLAASGRDAGAGRTEPDAAVKAARALMQLGGSSGADLLCGVLLALTGPPLSLTDSPHLFPDRSTFVTS